MKNYLIGSNLTAIEGMGSARPDAKMSGDSIPLVRGVIEAVNGDGYDVIALDDQGARIARYQLVSSYPSATYSPDQEVWLYFEPGSTEPIIFSGGGGGSTCSMAVNNFGVLFG